MTTMKVLDLFGLKYFNEGTPIRFRYVVFLNQLKPKIYFEKQLSQFDVIKLDQGLRPRVSDRPDMVFLNTITSRLLGYFESLQYTETKNAIIYYTSKEGVLMLSKSSLVPVTSKGIAPKNLTPINHVPEEVLKKLDDVVQQITNYYMVHWSSVLMYYNWVRLL
jgi:hypothetical protein